MKPTHEVYHDNNKLFTGSYDDCWVYIQKHQSQSVDWAMKYEHWEIREIK